MKITYNSTKGVPVDLFPHLPTGVREQMFSHMVRMKVDYNLGKTGFIDDDGCDDDPSFRAANQWCNEHCAGRFTIFVEQHYALFEKEEDMTLFKLASPQDTRR